MRFWEQNILQFYFAESQGSSLLYICAKHGLQWDNGISNVVVEEEKKHNASILESANPSPGLFPFMVAALRELWYDLNRIFQ